MTAYFGRDLAWHINNTEYFDQEWYCGGCEIMREVLLLCGPLLPDPEYGRPPKIKYKHKRTTVCYYTICKWFQLSKYVIESNVCEDIKRQILSFLVDQMASLQNLCYFKSLATLRNIIEVPSLLGNVMKLKKLHYSYTEISLQTNETRPEYKRSLYGNVRELKEA